MQSDSSQSFIPAASLLVAFQRGNARVVAVRSRGRSRFRRLSQPPTAVRELRNYYCHECIAYVESVGRAAFKMKRFPTRLFVASRDWSSEDFHYAVTAFANVDFSRNRWGRNRERTSNRLFRATESHYSKSALSAASNATLLLARICPDGVYAIRTTVCADESHCRDIRYVSRISLRWSSEIPSGGKAEARFGCNDFGCGTKREKVLRIVAWDHFSPFQMNRSRDIARTFTLSYISCVCVCIYIYLNLLSFSFSEG